MPPCPQRVPAGSLPAEPRSAFAYKGLKLNSRNTKSHGLLSCPLNPPQLACPLLPTSGASLVELYSAFAYEGPKLVPRVKRELAALLEKDGYSSVAEAVGADHRAAAMAKAK